MIKPLFNAEDDEWVVLVGRYILNMGALELATRLLISRIEGSDATPIFVADLAARLGFLRSRFPREDKIRHQWAMNVFEVADKHCGFRNIVAHSPLAMTSDDASGTFGINGIVNVTPKSKETIAQLVSIEELKGRVNESAAIARDVLDMQTDFAQQAANKPLQPIAREDARSG